MNQSCGPSSLPSGALAAGVFGAELEISWRPSIAIYGLPTRTDKKTIGYFSFAIQCKIKLCTAILEFFGGQVSSSKRFFTKKNNIASIDGQEREFLGTRQTIYGHTEKLL